MSLLILGLAVFFAIHLLPSAPRLRERLLSGLGAQRYRLIFATVAIFGFVLIVIGKSRAPFEFLYVPPVWGRHATMLLVLIAMILLSASHMPSNLKRLTPHPMLWATILWAIGHLLANGDVASVLLFGGFLVFAVLGIASANRRGARPATEAVPYRRDLIVVAAGVVIYLVFIGLHQTLFGVPVLRL